MLEFFSQFQIHVILFHALTFQFELKYESTISIPVIDIILFKW